MTTPERPYPDIAPPAMRVHDRRLLDLDEALKAIAARQETLVGIVCTLSPRDPDRGGYSLDIGTQHRIGALPLGEPHPEQTESLPGILFVGARKPVLLGLRRRGRAIWDPWRGEDLRAAQAWGWLSWMIGRAAVKHVILRELATGLFERPFPRDNPRALLDAIESRYAP